MALAPIAQTLLIKLDGGFYQPDERVTVPPFVVAPAPTINNTLGSSNLLGSSVSGFATLANLLDARLTAVGV